MNVDFFDQDFRLILVSSLRCSKSSLVDIHFEKNPIQRLDIEIEDEPKISNHQSWKAAWKV